MFSMLASMGHLGYCISLQMSHFQAMWIRNAFLLILWGWWGWKNICFKLKGYHNFGDPNDRVLKNNALHYGNIRLALQSYGDKCTHTAVTCVITSDFYDPNYAWNIIIIRNVGGGVGPRGLPCTCEKDRGAHPKILFGCGYDLICFYPEVVPDFSKKTHTSPVRFFCSIP